MPEDLSENMYATPEPDQYERYEEYTFDDTYTTPRPDSRFNEQFEQYSYQDNTAPRFAFVFAGSLGGQAQYQARYQWNRTNHFTFPEQEDDYRFQFYDYSKRDDYQDQENYHQPKQEAPKPEPKPLPDPKEFKKNYEEKMAEFRKNHVSDIDNVPWPYVNTAEDLEKLLFFDLQKGSKEYKKYATKQLIIWHPDKIKQTFGDKLKPEDEKVVLERMKNITQVLTKLKNPEDE